MATLKCVNSVFRKLSLLSLQDNLLQHYVKPTVIQVCHYNFRRIPELMPDPAKIPSLRAKVHLPEDGYYTTRPLPQTKLGGRDPETNRVIHGRIGGGYKWKHRWVDYYREGPTTKGDFLYEKIIEVIKDPNRTADVALVNHGERVRYIIATTSMKQGQVIKTSSYIPRMPVLASEGDAYPVGALPLGTKICCVSLSPGEPGIMCINAGMSATLKSRMGDNYIMEMPNKKMYILDPRCMCTVGQVSNPEHQDIPIGSPNNLRNLGWRPRSGLWQRKTGYHGRKIKPIPPPKAYSKRKPPKPILLLTLKSEEPTYKIIQCVKRKT